MQEKAVSQYDAGYKEELSKKKEFIHFLKKYVHAPWAMNLTPEDVELCDKEFVLQDFKKRDADLVYRIRFGDLEIYCYIIMELQSGIDFTMPFRLLTYVFSLMLKIFLEEDEIIRGRKDYRLPAVIPILFYNGETPWSAPKLFSGYQTGHELFAGHLVDFEYYLVDLTQITNDYILSTNTLIDNVLALDKNKRNTPQLSSILELLQERLKNLTEDDQVSFGKWMEYVLLAVVDDTNEEKVRLLIEKLRGDAQPMIHGLQEVILNERAAGVEEGIERGIKQGLEQGIKAFIRTTQKENIPRDRILKNLREQFELPEEKAEEYLKKYW